MLDKYAIVLDFRQIVSRNVNGSATFVVKKTHAIVHHIFSFICVISNSNNVNIVFRNQFRTLPNSYFIMYASLLIIGRAPERSI